MLDLTGKTALVTGASGGIGGAVARALSTHGVKVAISGTRQDALDKLALELGGQDVYVLVANLSDRDAVDWLAKQADHVLGGVDILVNNAGLTRDGLAVRMKDDDWDRVIEVNLTSSYRLTRALLRGMMRRRTGRVINISSIVGTTGNLGQANYCASKAGLTGLSKSLAQEVASRGITVNCVAPGFIETAMTDALNKEQKNRINQNIPMARMGTTAEIAAAVTYLASNEAGYVTGQTLHVNGGLAMP